MAFFVLPLINVALSAVKTIQFNHLLDFHSLEYKLDQREQHQHNGPVLISILYAHFIMNPTGSYKKIPFMPAAVTWSA